MVGFGRLTPPSPSSALPPQDYPEAVPKYISGRTSYLRVRLAFHPYPQLIPAFCNRHGFGPPSRDYRDFNLAMGSSPGFGSNPDNTPSIMETPFPPSPELRARVFATEMAIPEGARIRVSGFHIVSARFAPCLDSLSLRLQNFYSLTKLPRLTRRLILQKARGHPSLEGLPRLVGLRFQVYFTPLPGFFSPFPHGTGSLSVAKGI